MLRRKPRPSRRVTQGGLSREYRRACDAWKKATDDMAEAQRLYYREQSINWNKFLSAQLNYKAAARRFDEAFEKEHRRDK